MTDIVKVSLLLVIGLIRVSSRKAADGSRSLSNPCDPPCETRGPVAAIPAVHPNSLWILKSYRFPHELRAPVPGGEVVLERDHEIDFHAATFTTIENYRLLREETEQQVEMPRLRDDVAPGTGVSAAVGWVSRARDVWLVCRTIARTHPR